MHARGPYHNGLFHAATYKLFPFIYNLFVERKKNPRQHSAADLHARKGTIPPCSVSFCYLQVISLYLYITYFWKKKKRIPDSAVVEMKKGTTESNDYENNLVWENEFSPVSEPSELL